MYHSRVVSFNIGYGNDDTFCKPLTLGLKRSMQKSD